MARALFYVAALLIFAFSTPSFASDPETGNREKRDASTCTSEFANIQGHTMCFTDSPMVLKSGVSQKDREVILREHNLLRSQVSSSATDLTLLEWSDKLAAVAQKWAKQCYRNHDKHRSVPSLGLLVGQNMGYFFSASPRGVDWEKIVKFWGEEKKHFVYGQGSDDGKWTTVSDYTQIITNTTFLVGCGYAQCSNIGQVYVCNYAAGCLLGQMSHPYTAGSSCGACPDNCDKNLCQCSLLCKHQGKLNLATCTCECPLIWSGPTCNTLACPLQDCSICGNGLPRNYCRIQTVRDGCPKMCGLC